MSNLGDMEHNRFGDIGLPKIKMIRREIPGPDTASLCHSGPSLHGALVKRRKTASDSRYDFNPMSAPMRTSAYRIPYTPRPRATSRENYMPSRTIIVDLANETSGSEIVTSMNKSQLRRFNTCDG